MNVHVHHVDYKLNADETSQFAQYRAGQLDLTDTVPVNALPSIRKNNPGELLIAPILGTAYYGLNTATPPLAGNSSLRTALAMAIDRKRLVELLGFGQLPAYGLLPNGTWNYSSQEWPWVSASDDDRVKEAKRLYARSGYSGTTPLRLRLLFNANPVIKRTAVLIAAMWKDTLGVDTVFEEQEFRTYLQSTHDKTQWEVARLSWGADYNDATSFLDVLRAKSPNNHVGYSSKTFDALLDEAATAPDPHVRRHLLEAAERVMLNDCPIIPLYFYVSRHLVKPYLRNVEINPHDRAPSKLISIVAH